VRFLIRDGWLAHYLNFAGERMLPTMPKLLEAPFWLDLGDPHRMASAMQLLTKPRALDWYTLSICGTGWWARRQSGRRPSIAS
jgi:hypothetical protein